MAHDALVHAVSPMEERAHAGIVRFEHGAMRQLNRALMFIVWSTPVCAPDIILISSRFIAFPFRYAAKPIDVRCSPSRLRRHSSRSAAMRSVFVCAASR